MDILSSHFVVDLGAANYHMNRGQGEERAQR